MSRRTRNVEKVIEEGLIGEPIDPLIASLSEEDRALYDEMLAELRASGTVPDIWKHDYVKAPPTIEEFITDDYYLGRALRPSEDNQGLFPIWRKDLINDFDIDSKIHNAVLTGSMGTGKTYVAVVILLYRLAVTTFLRNPQNFFGLSRGSKIIYNTLSVTKAAVTETAFGDAMNFMAQSGYFTQECGFNPDMQYAAGRIEIKKTLPDNRHCEIYLTAGSKGQHILGRNVLGVLLDEGNFRLEKDPDIRAYELYDQIRQRIKNRFQKVAGFLPAISLLASSAADESSFTERVITDINNAKDPATQKVYRYAVYEVKAHVLRLSPRWFKVAYGLKNLDPFILGGFYTKTGEPIGEGHELPPNGASTELVPMDFYEEFRRNCRNSLMSQSGISVGGSFRFLSSTVDLEHCVELSTGLINPCKAEMIPLSAEDDKNVWDYLTHKNFLTRVASRYQPLRHPNAMRYVHLDLATQTMAGLGICHLVGHQLVEGIVKDGQPFSEYRLVVEYDFLLTIIAGETKPINLEKIQRFIFWLRDWCNYRFGIVTADQFQSDMPLQMLEAGGFKVGKLSVDRDKTVYNAFRTAVQEWRVRIYHQSQLWRELENLLEMNKKFDHPPTGSKDTSDGAAGALFNALNSDEKLTIMSHDVPAIHKGHVVETGEDRPPMEIVVPEKTLSRTMTFKG